LEIEKLVDLQKKVGLKAKKQKKIKISIVAQNSRFVGVCNVKTLFMSIPPYLLIKKSKLGR
jgi:hypothetical protein